MDIRRTVFFSGSVQGVGFRYVVQRLAAGFEITGYVRNLPDGRVELLMEGERLELDTFETEVADRMVDYIEHTERDEAPATGEYPDFAIH